MTQARLLVNGEKEECFDNEDEDLHVPRKPGEAPDGGWGWVVVFGTFLCCLFINGLQFSYRELVKEISDNLHAPQESVIYVGNLMTCFSFLGGPLAYLHVTRFGCRKVVIGGCVVTFVALVASSWVPSLTALHITYGVLAGVGCSLIYLPSIVIVALWFHDRRAFATGLALTGSGVGVFVFPPLYKHLLDNHSWRNALVIMSAIFLNCAPAGTLFRPLIYAKQKVKKCLIQRGAIMKALIAEKERQRTISNGSLDNCVITRDNRLIKIDKNDLKNKSISYLNRIKESLGFSSRSLNGCKSKSAVPKVVVDPCNFRLLPVIRLNNLNIRSDIRQLPSSTPPTPKRDSGIGSLNNSPKSKSCEALPTEEALVVSLPYNKQTASLSASHINNFDKLNNLDSPGQLGKKVEHSKIVIGLLSDPSTPETRRHNMDDRFWTISNSSTYSKTSPSVSIPGSILSIPNHQSINYAENVITSDVSSCRKMDGCLDLKILKSFTFWLLSLSSFCTMLGYIISQVHLLEKACLLGMTMENANFMISIFWVVHTLGRLAMGWVADRPWASVVQLNNSMILLAGVMSCFSIKYTSGHLLYTYAALFGISTGSYFVLQSIISIELFGKDRFSCVLGLVSFFQGLAMLAGHKISDLLHGYSDTAICIAGGCMLLAAVLGFPLRKIEQWERKRSECALKIVQIEEIENDLEMEVLKVENCESKI